MRDGRCHTFLYRSAWVVVILALAAGVGVTQVPEEAPQVAPRKKPVKKDNEPRAVGLLQIRGGKATLIPVAIMIDKKFYDASAYKATPVPMALEPGTVYEAERTGESIGLFTVGGALHSVAENTPAPWLGTGQFLAGGTEPTKRIHQAELVPVGIEGTDAPPRLTRGAGPDNADSQKTGSSKDDEAGKTPKNPADSTSTSAAPSGSSSPTAPGAGSTTQSKSPSGPASGTPPGTPGLSSGSNPPATTNKTPGAAPTSKDQSTAAKTPPSGQDRKPASEFDGPRLRRGKPTEPLPDDDIPGYAKVGAGGAVTKNAAGASNSAAPGASAPVELIPAISDAGGPQPRSYKFDWTGEDQEKRRKQMLDLAADEFRTYLRKEAQARISPKPATKQGTTAHKVATKPQAPIFENEHFQAFDVWLNNQPVMILSADVHMPPSPQGAAAGEPSGPYTCTLVARTDIYGNLRKLYWGVTDKFHLDVTPRLELIDAVDADGDGRGELLFKEISDAGTGYVIYRPTADVLWKLFDSLNQE